jgi:hypothetical protein
MDWRLISAVTLAGASFSMVALGAYTLRAADAVPAGADRAASPLLAPSLTPAGTGVVGIIGPERGVSFIPAAPGGGASPSPEAVPASLGVQVAAVDGASPVLVADPPVLLQDKVANPSNLSGAWRHRHHVTWKVGHRARFCTLLRPCGTDRKHQVAARHGDERHSTPRMALVLGTAF